MTETSWVTDVSIVKAIKEVGVLDNNALDVDTTKLNKGLSSQPKIAGTMVNFGAVPRR